MKSPNERAAARDVDRLLGLLPPQDLADPETFIAGAVAVFAEYSPEVRSQAVIEVAKRSDRLRIHLISKVLQEIDERAREREQVAKRLPPPPEKPRTPEEQARIDKSVADARRRFGIPPDGLRRRR
jgi:hypothetical protein